MKKNGTQLTAQLSALGFTFSHSKIEEEGHYTAADAKWNYIDVPHLYHVHNTVKAVFSSVTDEHAASIYMLRMMGLTFPLPVYNFHSGENSMTYYTSWFFFVLIIDTICEDTGANRCKVTTNIHLGSPWYLAWMRPLMLWSLKRNHEVLVSEDFPMRNRRGLLRDWGYGFKVDGSYKNSMDVTRSNVIFPKSAQSFPEVNLVLDRDLPNGSQYLAGREDHLGLRLVRQDEEIRLFPRLCPHEGACLDASSCKASKIICHWHGRIFNPMAVLNVRTSKHILTEYHEIRLENGTLTLKVKAG